MGLFRRKARDDEPVDMQARSPDTGLRYKDISLLGQMMKSGVDFSTPRHVVYYLYFSTQQPAEVGAVEARNAGYDAEVREPIPEDPNRWALVCEKHDAILSIDYVRDADDLFQGIADRLAGEFDGWEAAV